MLAENTRPISRVEVNPAPIYVKVIDASGDRAAAGAKPSTPTESQDQFAPDEHQSHGFQCGPSSLLSPESQVLAVNPNRTRLDKKNTQPAVGLTCLGLVVWVLQAAEVTWLHQLQFRKKR